MEECREPHRQRPLKVSSVAEDQEWTFEANDNYWQGRLKLDGIDYVYVDDAAVALEAYRSGDLDIVSLEPPQIPEVQADPVLAEEMVVYPLASTYNLEMNLTTEPFNDPKVRQAFAYAFDRGDVLRRSALG
ncbi:MAG: ABC transporter substrate-binding protein [Thermomicrobiales bacterium]